MEWTSYFRPTFDSSVKRHIMMMILVMMMMLMMIELIPERIVGFPLKQWLLIHNNFGFQLRVFKLAQSWQTMGMLLSTIGGSVGQLGNLTLVLFIIVYMFAVVGMQLFGKKYTADKFGGNPEDIPRWNFADFGHACMMIFRVLCGEWIEPLYDCMRATNPASTVFFLCALVIGNFLVRLLRILHTSDMKRGLELFTQTIPECNAVIANFA